MADRGFLVAPGLADRMISTIRRVEGAPYKYGNASIPVRFEEEEGGGGGGGSTFRICTFTGAWSKSQQKTVTFKYQSQTPNTVVATNLFANVGVTSSSQRNCAISSEGGTWFLIAAECD